MLSVLHALDRLRKRDRIFSYGFAATVVVLMVVCLIPNRQFELTMSPSSACMSNLTNLGTACEMYASDHTGCYPRSLKAITPNYLKSVPTCPNRGRYCYAVSAQPDAYTIVCPGLHHGDVSEKANFPQYTSAEGLRAK